MNLMSDIVKIVEKHKKYSQVSQITLYMQNALPVQNTLLPDHFQNVVVIIPL